MKRMPLPSRALSALSFLFLATLAALVPITAAAQELPRVAPADAGFEADRLALIEQVLNDYVMEGELPGAVVAVLRSGAVVYEKAVGYSDIETGAPLTPGRRFPASRRRRKPSSASP